MNLIHALIFGCVEGITEFLPISSTAHLEITARLLHLAQSDFLKSFEIVIQLGAILAVVVVYFSWLRQSVELWKRIIVAFIPTGIIGFILYKLIKTFLLGNIQIIIWTLGIGGIALIIFELIYRNEDAFGISSREELEQIPYSTALLIGIAQSIAVVPGVSRSAATIIAGRVLGISRRAIVEFSFLLAIPTMLAASGYDILKNANAFSKDQFTFLAVGFIASGFFAFCAIKTFLHIIKRRSMIGFGIYRIILAIIIFMTLQ
jgi:undecaprenyl-diphosphatase